MTPFAQLELLEKRAAPAPAPGYQVNPQSGLKDPNSTPVAASTGRPWGSVQNFWGDLALSSIPIVSTAYLGNKAVQDYRYGNIGGGLGNSIWTAMSLIPGAGLAKGVLGGAGKGVGSAAMGGLRGSATLGPLGVKGTVGASAAGAGAGLFGPATTDYTKPAAPMNPMLRAGMMTMGLPGLIGGGMNLIDSYRQPTKPAYTPPTTPAPALNPNSNAGILNRAMTNAVVNNGRPPTPAPAA